MLEIQRKKLMTFQIIKLYEDFYIKLEDSA